MVKKKVIKFNRNRAPVRDNLSNSAVLSAEIEAFTGFLAALGFASEDGLNTSSLINGNLEIKLPDLAKTPSSYSQFIEDNQLSPLQRSIFILTLLPELRPGILDQLFIYDQRIEKGMADLGGVKGKFFTGFIPTVETALFLFAGYNLDKRFRILTEFYDNSLMVKKGIIILEPDNGETFASRKIEISKDIFAQVTQTELPSPHFCSDFPAKQLKTNLVWSDDSDKNHLILSPFTQNGLSEMVNWITHQKRLKDMKLMPGYRCLFYGPPGTGKTLTANLIGKRYELPIYRIDLSLMVSKYIGETEKNLEKVFSMAENKDWILFFDEADSLFGKRTEVNSSNDKFANQETSFLLQRVEDFSGLVILATNYKENLDQAFIRRFQSIINFPMPSVPERILLWNKALNKVSSNREDSDTNEHYTFQYDTDIQIEIIAKKVEISGASIDNVIRYCVLNAFNDYFATSSHTDIRNHQLTIKRRDLLKAIKREINKEGKII
jgi:adenylate kinase family enzyme